MFATHEYPDPDYAAYVTKYPWREDDGYLPSALHGLPPESLEEISRAGVYSSPQKAGDDGGEVLDSVAHGPAKEVTWDPDYQESEAGLTEDENVSDEDSYAEALKGRRDETRLRQRQRSGRRADVSGRNSSAPRKGRRGRGGRVGRGGKGMKKGLRKPIEPTPEFKALHSQATMAFIDQNYEEAENLTLQALLINPEMYPAHNLLSEIHAARGDKAKALSAAWNGAHTRPRDPEMWSRIARLILERDDDDRDSTLRDAIYCYNRILYVDSSNVEARYQRAALNHELGHKRKAANEYEQLIKQLPHDTTVLRHLAEIYIDLDEPDNALSHYEATIYYFQSVEPCDVTSFTWSDVNIVCELYGVQRRCEEGITVLKTLSRWLLGRAKEKCWEAFDEDDREWDLEDQPRRNDVPGFVPGEHDVTSYGDGLPLELRVKLGVFRLKSENRNLMEAINHFECLDPEDDQNGAKIYDYPDLFREAANALRVRKYFHEALRYYEPIKKVSEYGDAAFFMEMASCYKAVGLRTEAEDCYMIVVDSDKGSPEARRRLLEMCSESDVSPKGAPTTDEVVSVKQHKARKRVGGKEAKQPKKSKALPSWATTMLAPRLVPQSAKQISLEREEAQEEDVNALFLRREALTEQARNGDESSKTEWMAITKTLIQEFKDNKVFYPLDKHHKFYGYSREARSMAARPKHELDALAEQSKSHLETAQGDQIVIPGDYCRIPFDCWLEIFLAYALTLAHGGNILSSYEIIAAAFHANVFYHSPESLFCIHVCWFTCALLGNDDETLCNIARWFMKEYQFVTDGYRLFSALNRLSDTENSWYNCGPSQKYILRQLKAVDFSLLGDSRRKSLFQERASYTTKDDNGNQIRAQEMDVVLLMLYGHILYAGKSYAYAVNYFLRALALDPTNVMIKFSLALGYLHYALKRQADNRHHILMQGLAFLLEYYDCRQRSSRSSEKQEAEYNVAHAYHLLGLTHLAIPYYERCLAMSAAAQVEESGCRAEDIAQEAAFALQNLWAASGNMEKAWEITEKWLVVR
ncbi:hypothetical protein HO133_004547 [Letharia lupina]|uniref:Uncharacterized protein n=1 Tax=Letharia lupina TaxID=560253 RepID=A0A8H6FKL4_9LECA|nr:uncharacterized protein HO133_004547 [Letharia lupina]KAF6230208.1 hypothetical protein HO133_004547 [Letharia lupina]